MSKSGTLLRNQENHKKSAPKMAVTDGASLVINPGLLSPLSRSRQRAMRFRKGFILLFSVALLGRGAAWVVEKWPSPATSDPAIAVQHSAFAAQAQSEIVAKTVVLPQNSATFAEKEGLDPPRVVLGMVAAPVNLSTAMVGLNAPSGPHRATIGSFIVYRGALGADPIHVPYPDWDYFDSGNYRVLNPLHGSNSFCSLLSLRTDYRINAHKHNIAEMTKWIDLAQTTRVVATIMPVRTVPEQEKMLATIRQSCPWIESRADLLHADGKTLAVLQRLDVLQH